MNETNYHEGYPFFITVLAKHPEVKNGRENDMHIQTVDWNGRPDAQVGDFGLNFFFRPKAATRPYFKGYKSLAILKAAVTRCLKAKGFTDIRYEI